ncbi:unnamed protein product [Schistosoma intercalatum]|nr:unnamed protein product [Schistosoma intercalatum]CAH8428649.1 unnamed protein product [Schistosoma intercalatum]
MHGRCALQDPLIGNQYRYFKFGIDEMKKLKLLDNLKKHGITPHASMKYDASDFQNVLKKEYGHHGFLKCTNVIGQSGVRLLEEVRICFNLTHHYVDCHSLGDCPNQFVFPPY